MSIRLEMNNHKGLLSVKIINIARYNGVHISSLL